MLSAEQITYVYGECCEESNYQNVYTYMVNVVSRANQFILGQNVYTYMVNVVSRANQFILGQNCLYLYGECCEQSRANHMVNVVRSKVILGQNVYTYMVNVVRRAIIKMQSKSVHTYMNVVSRAKCLYLYGECCQQSKSVILTYLDKMFILIW